MIMEISAIVACTQTGVIGKNGTIPWYFPEDMQRFRSITAGHAVIMGRKTFESLGNRPLRNRINIVVTSKNLDRPEIEQATDIEGAIKIARDNGAKKCFLIGGQRIYEEGLKYCQKVHLTKINMDIPEGEAFFPIKELEETFEPESREVLNQFVEFVTYIPKA